MKTPPKQIGGANVVLFTPIDERHRISGDYRVHFGRTAWGSAARLAICRYDEPGFYLFGCDEHWSSVTDTWHETIEDAMAQAESEAAGVAATWQRTA